MLKMYHNKVFESLIIMIMEKKIDVKIINNEFPKIFYIGLGKTGSQAIMHGFDVSIAHWHSVEFFEKKYKTKLLSKNNLEIYDLIFYVANKYNFKPLIIEIIREPISLFISRLCHASQFKSFQRKHKDVTLNQMSRMIREYVFNLKNIQYPYSYGMWKKYFNVDLYKEFDQKNIYYYNETDKAKLLFFKYEGTDRDQLFKSLNIKFQNKIINQTKGAFSNKLKDIIKHNPQTVIHFTKNEIDDIYNHASVKAFYTKQEIEQFKIKYLFK